MQQSIVSLIVFFYIFVGVALLAFNLMYMAGSSRRGRAFGRMVEAEMAFQMRMAIDRSGSDDVNDDRKYRRKLFRQLTREECLLTFDSALERNLKKEPPGTFDGYLRRYHDVISDAAMYYCRRPAMERALFSHLVSILPATVAMEYRRLGELLLTYLEDSTIYCRENVLQALYKLGNDDALERALRLFQEKGWYHSSKLLADGMIQFNGDREALARRLWAGKWDDGMRAVLIQFMNNLPADLSELVMPELSSRHEEVRFAAIRYFARHVREEAAPAIREIAGQGDDTAAAAARALGSYPGRESKEVLVKALTSGNWYVRRNAAESLMEMDLTEEDVRMLSHHDDKYAREMFVYVLESREKKRC